MPASINLNVEGTQTPSSHDGGEITSGDHTHKALVSA